MRLCKNCTGSDVDVDQARGHVICMGCGSVLEDNIIVSEMEFVETGAGRSHVVGQFVSTDGGAKAPSFGYAHLSGMGRESRAQTVQRAKQHISTLGHQLQMSQRRLDMALNFYKMALNKQLTRGRRSSHVIAACIYMVCRTEGTPHMLLDLSDLVQVNVYILGKTFLALAKELCINAPAIDPCLYIPRFAQMLEFGEKNHDVSMTALRLVQRMKRDWMHTGRRPSGLCGAALLVSAHMHNFCRTVKEVVSVVKVCETTLRKRLMEFEDTPTSQLTIEEFMKVDLDKECDPPCYTEGLVKKQLEIELKKKMGNVEDEIHGYQAKIDAELESSRPKLKGVYATYVKQSCQYATVSSPSALKVELQEPDEDDALRAVAQHFGKDVDELKLEALIELERQAQDGEDQDQDIAKRQGPTLESILGLIPSSATLSVSHRGSKEEKENDRDPDGGELDLSGIDDTEIDLYLLNENEVKIKTMLWIAENSNYLKEQMEKEAKIVKEKELGIYKERKPRNLLKCDQIQVNTADKAIRKMLEQKKISSKINYDVLKDINVKPNQQDSMKLQPKPAKVTPLGSLGKRLQPFISKQPNKKLALEQSSNPLAVPAAALPPGAVVVESGPMSFDVAAAENKEDEEEEACVSVMALMGHKDYGCDSDYNDDC